MIETHRTWRVLTVPEFRVGGVMMLLMCALIEATAVLVLVWGPQIMEFDTQDYAWWVLMLVLNPAVAAGTVWLTLRQTRRRALRHVNPDTLAWPTVRAATIRVADGKLDRSTYARYKPGRLVLSEANLELWTSATTRGPALSVRRADISGVELINYAMPGSGPMLGLRCSDGLRIEVVLAFGTIWDFFGSRAEDVKAVGLAILPNQPVWNA